MQMLLNGSSCYLGVGTLAHGQANMSYVLCIPNGSQILSLESLLQGAELTLYLSQNITFFFLVHLIILMREEFSGFTEEYIVYYGGRQSFPL